ncbi:hypothetical protein BpHYR1_004852 [Brachionus plicatilis]|uniref:Uncharacterized protein n=1 Tax=Brachionus plicatilis TaxID=10195 RepID=A0A3M7SYF8_BRAPC|nr:hypothetical protein BpHYR1_004852 [Brachionus plicatilis]
MNFRGVNNDQILEEKNGAVKSISIRSFQFRKATLLNPKIYVCKNSANNQFLLIRVFYEYEFYKYEFSLTDSFILNKSSKKFRKLKLRIIKLFLIL